MVKIKKLVAIVAAAAFGLGACGSVNLENQSAKLNMPSVIGKSIVEFSYRGIVARLHDSFGNNKGYTIFYYRESEDKPFGVFQDGFLSISCNYPYTLRDKTILVSSLAIEETKYYSNAVCGYKI